jgi:hypothetical protein
MSMDINILSWLRRRHNKPTLVCWQTITLADLALDEKLVAQARAAPANI